MSSIQKSQKAFCITPSHLAQVTTLSDLLPFLRDQLDWPYDDSLDDISFDETSESLGLDASTPLPKTIRQLRMPPGTHCPWGVFLLEFDHVTVPRTTLRRVLRALLRKKRASNNSTIRASFDREDLLFIVSYGPPADAGISFIHAARPRQPEGKHRLASFGWSKTSHNRTAAEHNLPNLRWLDDSATPAEWRDALAHAFDKEVLTKQFYKTLEDVYRNILVPDIQRHVPNEEAAKQAALLLTNRLLFLYFVQRKGWLSKSQSYLVNAFKPHRAAPRAHTFYTDFLSLLFQALALPKGTPGRLTDAVPFLNGGLFEPNQTITDADLKISNASFAALFDRILEPYNFTVTEDTPLDIEVAVDPEMLGKVFEQLILNRHGQGAYYTPRPIVSYMCREALKAHLGGYADLVDRHDAAAITIAQAKDIFVKLENLKAVDPACGSGAYLVGLLHEIDEIICALDTQVKPATPRDEYTRKLSIIEKNLYGVDKDPAAVNLARLRLWLSLVVEYEGNDPPPLPNLDFKIEQGDSLIVPAPTLAGQSNLFWEELFPKFADAKARYQAASDPSLKYRLKDEIERIREEIKVAVRGEALSATGDGFDWWVEFAEVFNRHGARGFDIVLANPPYVNSGEILRNSGSKYKAVLVKAYPNTGSGTADLLVFFMERALHLLHDGGQLCFITSNKWLKAAYGKKLRSHLADGNHVSTLIDFRDLPVFQGTIAYPLITIAAKGGSQERTKFVSVPSLEAPFPDVAALVQQCGVELPPNALGSDGEWHLDTGTASDRLAQMRSRGVNLIDYVEGKIFRGIVTGLNEVKVGSDGKMYGKSLPPGVRKIRSEGVFVISGERRAQLIAADIRSAEIIKPLLVGKDVSKWGRKVRDRWLIFCPWDLKIKQYPAILKHLQQYKSVLTARPEVQEGRFPWWALSRYGPEFNRYFESDKIVYQEIAGTHGFGWAGAGIYLTNKVSMVVSSELWLLAILNSTAAWQFFRQISPALVGGAVAMQVPTVSQLPIPTIPDDDANQLSVLVSKCISIREKNSNIDISDLEAEIDRRIEFLYFHADEAATYDEWIAKKEAERGTAVEAVRALIAAGEGGAVEFKQSLEYVDPATVAQVPEPHRARRLAEDQKAVIHSALKTICAFLNSSGGTLLLGVHDDGSIIGIEPDYALCRKKDRDGFELKLHDLLARRLEPMPLDIKVRCLSVDGKTVCRIDVSAKPNPHYLDNKLYVRFGNSTRELTGRPLQDWISNKEVERRPTVRAAESRDNFDLKEAEGLSVGTDTCSNNEETDDDKPDSFIAEQTGRSINEVSLQEALATIRKEFTERGTREGANRDDVLKAVSAKLGFSKLGKNIRSELESSLRAAVMRRIIERVDGNGTYALATRTIEDYLDEGRDKYATLRKYLGAALGPRWTSLEDAITQTARYLGFARTGDTIRSTLTTTITSAINRDELEKRGSEVRVLK